MQVRAYLREVEGEKEAGRIGRGREGGERLTRERIDERWRKWMEKERVNEEER